MLRKNAGYLSCFGLGVLFVFVWMIPSFERNFWWLIWAEMWPAAVIGGVALVLGIIGIYWVK